ncbi:MAG: hypothetical protein AUJ97_00805 [Bacteroidetes bacterium CG2_30_32_10]|nr:MAG: hypothetical protein AUJ97_00805 [Bacteroidetes bacterium CG2_30_32_10]
MAIIWSCSKKDDNNATTNPTKIKTFTSGQANNNFANGASNHVFTGNDCIVGTWIVPKSSWSSCSQGYHLKLVFNDGGTGDAYHLDEYLCVTDQHKMFTWTHTSDSLFIVYDDETTSASPFVCSASQMLIYWNGNNPKNLIKQ